MGFTSIWHWLIVLAVVILLFGGRGKISALMGDFGKGLKNFKTGLKNDDETAEDGLEADDAKTLKSSAGNKDQSAGS